MTDTISKLLASYEKGGMSRRDLVRGLALLAAGAGRRNRTGGPVHREQRQSHLRAGEQSGKIE